MAKQKKPPAAKPDFSKPTAVTDLDLAFPGSLSGLLPEWEDIPEKFKSRRSPWSTVVNDWFFKGLPVGTKFHMKDGIDGNTAHRHLHVCLGSWEPKHEHKEAGVAYLMSLWMDRVEYPSAAALVPAES